MSADPPDSRMLMKKVGGVAYAVAAIVILLLAAKDVENALLWLHAFSTSTSTFAFCLAATAFATFGPFALSLWCWRVVGRVHSTWVVHLLFIPCAYAIVYIGASALDFADGRPGSDEPAGYALVAAFLLLGLTVIVHAAALTFGIVDAIRRHRTKAG